MPTEEPLQNPMRIQRPSIGSAPLGILTAIYILCLLNATFWRKGVEIFTGHELKLAALGVAIFLLAAALATALSFRLFLKPACVFFIVTAAVSAYFIDTFGVIIDGGMIANTVTTNFSEARHLITPNLVVHLILYAILPSVMIIWFRVEYPPFWTKIKNDSIIISVCVAVALIFLGLNYRTYATTFRERHDFLANQNPGAPIVGALHFAERAFRESNIPVAAIGEDAIKGSLLVGEAKPVLTVIVVGETARAQNFSLNGYARDTNPELAKRDVINFSDASSCGTATAVSVPCMFSVYTRDEYTSGKGEAMQNLLDVLSHAGVKTLWWDNNTGSKGVTARLGYEHLNDAIDQRYCADGECNDGILLERLRTQLPKITEDTVIILHQIGSHGPAYYLRYPKTFEKFKPACHTAQFSDCTQEEIIAAYDDTIVYTDTVLAKIIDMLKAQKNLATSLIYTSDHGESLGEGGLYLHGLPYVIAPETQTKVPFIAWVSDSFVDVMALDAVCMHAMRSKTVSHDNLFHTVLGFMNIKTLVYQPDLDIFSLCRQRPVHSSAS